MTMKPIQIMDFILGIQDLRVLENNTINSLLNIISYCYIIFAMLFMQLTGRV